MVLTTTGLSTRNPRNAHWGNVGVQLTVSYIGERSRFGPPSTVQNTLGNRALMATTQKIATLATKVCTRGIASLETRLSSAKNCVNCAYPLTSRAGLLLDVQLALTRCAHRIPVGAKLLQKLLSFSSAYYKLD